MNATYLIQRNNPWLAGTQQVLLHAGITAAAVGIAFSLPKVAQYILYQWWPKVTDNTNLLLATEIGLAAALVLLFNISHFAWVNRHKVRAADAAAIAFVREKGSWWARLRERSLLRELPAARDASILTVTGYNTFASVDSVLHGPLKQAYEIRVMLLNPGTKGALQRIDSLSGAATLEGYASEVSAAIDYLDTLRKEGKKVALKFYEEAPFWKVALLGDHAWVQYCHGGVQVKDDLEYVFALNKEHPRQGFYVPFYMYFLERWIDPRCPYYDFDTGELVYRNPLGQETRRMLSTPARAGETASESLAYAPPELRQTIHA